MKTPLRMLHVEDNTAHVETVRALLEIEDFNPQVTQVETEAQFQRALAEGDFELIVSDCTMPTFNGLAALELARERRPDLPFVFYSGTIGEEAAVESLKRGAMDFVPKSRPEKLGPTIRRVMQETEARRRRQEQRLREQRVECVGALAAGIAHSLNNVLTSVQVAAELLCERAVHDSDRFTLEIIRAQTKRGTEIVNEILSFARGTGDELTLLELKDLIYETGELLKAIFPRSIQIEIRVADDLYPVRGNATQLYQVLMNLYVNARDAMPHGGKVVIEATNDVLRGKRTAAPPGLASGPHVVLLVKDAGVGIPPALLDKIFEPFFTTKAIGEGAGLGLSTVVEIVKRHGGFVEVTSQVGQGTDFKVYLPATVRPGAGS